MPKQVLADLVACQASDRSVLHPNPAGMQVGREPVGTLDDLGIGIAAAALDDEFPIADHGRDGVGGGRDGELCCGVGHRASQGWWGSSLIIRPLASDSTLPSASVIVALTIIFRPSTESIHARDTNGSSVGVILR